MTLTRQDRLLAVFQGATGALRAIVKPFDGHYPFALESNEPFGFGLTNGEDLAYEVGWRANNALKFNDVGRVQFMHKLTTAEMPTTAFVRATLGGER